MNVRMISVLAALLVCGCTAESATEASDEKAVAASNSPESTTMATAKAFLMAAGSGDGATLGDLMADDFVWHNEGDKRVPWIGTWRGKDVVFNEFMPKFSAGLAVTQWSTDYEFVSGDQAVFMGTMTADATSTGESTGLMSWAVRVHVVDGKVKSWNWLEDSYAVSVAHNGDEE